MEMGMPDLPIKIVEVIEPNLGMSASIRTGVKVKFKPFCNLVTN